MAPCCLWYSPLLLASQPRQISPGQKSSELWVSLLAFFKFSLELGFPQPPVPSGPRSQEAWLARVGPAS